MSDRVAPVLPLAGYRAARFLEGCLHAPAWLESINVEVDENGDAYLAVRVLSDHPMIPRCLPTKISVSPDLTGIPVRVMVVDANCAGGRP